MENCETATFIVTTARVLRHGQVVPSGPPDLTKSRTFTLTLVLEL